MVIDYLVGFPLGNIHATRYIAGCCSRAVMLTLTRARSRERARRAAGDWALVKATVMLLIFAEIQFLRFLLGNPFSKHMVLSSSF